MVSLLKHRNTHLPPAIIIAFRFPQHLACILPHILARLHKAPGCSAGVPGQLGRQAAPACVPAVCMLLDLHKGPNSHLLLWQQQTTSRTSLLASTRLQAALLAFHFQFSW